MRGLLPPPLLLWTPGQMGFFSMIKKALGFLHYEVRDWVRRVDIGRAGIRPSKS
jgi:hypothetical protein